MLVGINPAKWHDPGLIDGFDHLQSQNRLGLEDQLLRQTTFSPFGRVRIVKPRFGDVEPAVEKSVTVSGCVNQEDSLLAIVEFAQRSAILPLHSDRMFPFLWETAPVNDHRSVRLSEICSHHLLMSLQNSIIAPSPFTDKLLHGSHGIEIFTALTQDHRFNALPLQVGALSAQIQLRPLALFAARKQRRLACVIAKRYSPLSRQKFSANKVDRCGSIFQAVRR